MNINLRLTPPHFNIGVMSKFMLMISSAIPYDANKLYFQYAEPHASENLFDFIFNQQVDRSYTEVMCVWTDNFSKTTDGAGHVMEAHSKYSRLRELCSKIEFHNNITSRVDKITNSFSDDILGVHIRSGDMNFAHPIYGTFTTDDYIRKIRELSPSRVYLAADNTESIMKVTQAISCPIITGGDMIRETTDTFCNPALQCNNMKNPIFISDAFVEALALSRCSEFLCRYSALANTAILFSDSFLKIHRL